MAWATPGIAPFPFPARRTGGADFPHPAFRPASSRGPRRRAEMDWAQPKSCDQPRSPLYSGSRTPGLRLEPSHARLGLVRGQSQPGQSQPGHHRPRPSQGLGRLPATEDDKVVGMVHDLGAAPWPLAGDPPVLRDAVHRERGEQRRNDPAAYPTKLPASYPIKPTAVWVDPSSTGEARRSAALQALALTRARSSRRTSATVSQISWRENGLTRTRLINSSRLWARWRSAE